MCDIVTHLTMIIFCIQTLEQKFLLQRHIITHFIIGCTEVHLLFDNQGELSSAPKYFKQQRRDQMNKIATGYN